MVLRLDAVLDSASLPSWVRVVHRSDALAEHGRAPTDVVHDGDGWHDAGRAVDDALARTEAVPPLPGEQVIELLDVVVASDGSVWHDDEAVTGRSWGLPGQPSERPDVQPVAVLDGLVANAALNAKAFGHWMLHRLPRLHTLQTRTAAERVLGTALAWDDGALYAAAGFPREDVTLLARRRPETAQVERLLLASQAAQPGGDRRIDQRRLDALIVGLEEHWSTVPTNLDLPLDVYVTRRSRPNERDGRRNANELESFFAEQGFTVVYPPDLPIEQQFALFRRARAVAGEFGSGMIWTMVCGPGTSVLQVTTSAGNGRQPYTATRRSWSRAIADARGQHYAQVIASPQLTERDWTADLSTVRRAWATRPEAVAPHLGR